MSSFQHILCYISLIFLFLFSHFIVEESNFLGAFLSRQCLFLFTSEPLLFISLYFTVHGKRVFIIYLNHQYDMVVFCSSCILLVLLNMCAMNRCLQLAVCCNAQAFFSSSNGKGGIHYAYE